MFGGVNFSASNSMMSVYQQPMNGSQQPMSFSKPMGLLVQKQSNVVQVSNNPVKAEGSVERIQQVAKNVELSCNVIDKKPNFPLPGKPIGESNKSISYRRPGPGNPFPHPGPNNPYPDGGSSK